MSSKKIHKILIANRGEIAVRIIKTLKKLSVGSVAIYAENDASSLHCRMADEARCIGNGSLKNTYLNIQKIIDTALDAGVDAIHPGYGFLSESPEFAEACVANNLIFIGPDAEVMRLMGNKIAARKWAVEHDIPVVFGVTGSVEDITSQASTLPYPILIKAAAGGGGKGMHIVRHQEELTPALEQASREAEKYFGNNEVYVEQYIENPRHIEVQVLADNFGNAVHLHERECSVQRRYQKIIEESPSPTLTDEKREAIFSTALKITKEIGYKNAGTIEFLVDNNLNFYFLEMNTRIQVEHPVTELRTGIDIVEEQIRIARGKEMGYTQDGIVAKGHAIECRIYAENPENGFLPAPGDITLYHEPRQRGVRIDSGIDGPCRISESYDPMIAKLICHGKTRNDAIETTKKALQEYIIQTEKTNIPYLQSIVCNNDFLENKIDTSYCEKHHDELLETMKTSRSKVKKEDVAAMFLFYDLNKKYLEHSDISSVWDEIGYWRYIMKINVEVDNKPVPVIINNVSPKSLKCVINNIDYQVTITKSDTFPYKVIVNGRSEDVFVSETPNHDYFVHLRGLDFICRRQDQLNDTKDYSVKASASASMSLQSPMPGTVVKVDVKEGDEVRRGTLLCIVEAMKMENMITSTASARVKKIYVKEGDKVDAKQTLIELE